MASWGWHLRLFSHLHIRTYTSVSGNHMNRLKKRGTTFCCHPCPHSIKQVNGRYSRWPAACCSRGPQGKHLHLPQGANKSHSFLHSHQNINGINKSQDPFVLYEINSIPLERYQKGLQITGKCFSQTRFGILFYQFLEPGYYCITPLGQSRYKVKKRCFIFLQKMLCSTLYSEPCFGDRVTM